MMQIPLYRSHRTRACHLHRRQSRRDRNQPSALRQLGTRSWPTPQRKQPEAAQSRMQAKIEPFPPLLPISYTTSYGVGSVGLFYDELRSPGGERIDMGPPTLFANAAIAASSARTLVLAALEQQY